MYGPAQLYVYAWEMTMQPTIDGRALVCSSIGNGIHKHTLAASIRVEGKKLRMGLMGSSQSALPVDPSVATMHHCASGLVLYPRLLRPCS